MVTVTFVLVDNQIPTASVLDGAVVRVYSQDGLTFVTQGTTDATGTLALVLTDATTYWVRFFKTGYSFQSKALISVDSGAASNTFDIVGTDLTVRPPSAVPELCRVSGHVVGASGEPVEGSTFRFSMTDFARIVGGRVVTKSKTITTSDSFGYIEVELIRDGVYDATIDGHEDTVYRVKVPDSESSDITDLIWPYVYDVDLGLWSTGASVSAGEDVEQAVAAKLSSGVVTPVSLDGDDLLGFGYFLSLESQDTAIATVTMNDVTGIMTLSGVAAGTTSVAFTVREGVSAARLPAPTVTLPTLSITVV